MLIQFLSLHFTALEGSQRRSAAKRSIAVSVAPTAAFFREYLDTAWDPSP